ncbi:MAG: glucokinase [Simkaniaceae bacterium]|nr:glucokinase [Simkaniaceae bacterium]
MFLAGDIGGTKTHLAYFEEENGKMKRIRSEKFPSKGPESLEAIISTFIKPDDPKVKKMCFGIAGPVKNGVARTTNLPWVVDADHIEKEFGVDNVYLLNDLEANAWGLKVLEESDLCTLNRGEPVEEANAALVSAGTGLGEAGIFYDGKMHIPFACEGGHADFAVRDERDVELFLYLKKKYGGHVSYERILCGRGIYDIYLYMVESGKEPRCDQVENLEEGKDPAVLVSELGLEKKDPTCEKALEWFVSIYGSEAGNCALKFMALSAVYIGGGIAPKILDAMKSETFMNAFRDKGRFNKLLDKIPVHVVLNDSTALLGAAYYCHTH